MSDLDHKKEACKTYIEQTKLLVTLASAFVLAPAAAIGLVRPPPGIALSSTEWTLVMLAEGLLILSVLSGYVVLGSVAGSQDAGTFDVYRPATMWVSRLQLGAYLVGVILLVVVLGFIVR